MLVNEHLYPPQNYVFPFPELARHSLLLFDTKIAPQHMAYTNFRYVGLFIHKFNIYNNWKPSFSFVCFRISKSLFS